MSTTSSGGDSNLTAEGLSTSPLAVDTPNTDSPMDTEDSKSDNEEAETAPANPDGPNAEASGPVTNPDAPPALERRKEDSGPAGNDTSRPPAFFPLAESDTDSDDDSGHAEWMSKLPKSSKLARYMTEGIVTYTKKFDDRLRKLEASERERVRIERAAGRVKTGEKPGGKEDQSENGQTAPVVSKPSEVRMEVKFLPAQDQFNSEGIWNIPGYLNVPGSRQSNQDPIYLIRVVYNWKDDVQPKELGEDTPNPDEIDILVLDIASEPIANFFTNRLNLTVGMVNIIRMGVPFRPLFRNLEPLREQLTKLEENYKVNDVGAGDSGPLEHADAPAPDGEVGNRVQESDDPLPFANVSEEKNNFDTKEALEHFRFLFKFIDKYFARHITLRQNLRQGKEAKVSFENLWMLFDAGDTIYCPSKEGGVVVSEDHTTKPYYVPQIFRVLSTVGGLRLRKTLAAPKGNNSDESNDIFSNQPLTAPYAKLKPDNAEAPASRKARDQFTPLHVVCFHLDFDGVKYGTVREIFVFKPFDGLVDINSLEAYPTQYLAPDHCRHGDGKSVECDRYLERGRKFIDVMAVSHMSYEGLTVGKSREQINSAVIVDFKLAFQEYQNAFAGGESVVPNTTSITEGWPSTSNSQLEVSQFETNTCGIRWCLSRSCVYDAYADYHLFQAQKAASEIKAVLEEYKFGRYQNEEDLESFKEYMEKNNLIRLLPGAVPGFALRNRKWIQLDLELLSKLEQRDDWDKLVLPDGHKEMVQAMVETHTRGSQNPRSTESSHQGKVAMDLVQGKGKGCIILLHGVPGVGKTSTAECVAAYTQRPLYPITCGDIGYIPEDVEMNMEEHFKLAHKWGCVLLLDEADVFLAKRTKENIKRNGLVSVFLRILEYYSGILFLTTNRVGAIDDAFRSRLHLTLFYPALKKEQTRKIWRHNLRRLKELNSARKENNQSLIDFDKDEILHWVDKHWKLLGWNGRQIRNAFQTAVALAEFAAKVEDEGDRRKPSAKKKTKRSETKTPSTTFIEVEHFVTIANASLEFNAYMEDVHGMNEDVIAHRDQIRSLKTAPAPTVGKKTLTRIQSPKKVKSSKRVEPSTSESSDADSRSGSESDDGTDSGSEDDSAGEKSDEGSGSEIDDETDKKRVKGTRLKDSRDKSDTRPKSSKGSKSEKELDKSRSKDKKNKKKKEDN